MCYFCFNRKLEELQFQMEEEAVKKTDQLKVSEIELDWVRLTAIYTVYMCMCQCVCLCVCIVIICVCYKGWFCHFTDACDRVRRTVVDSTAGERLGEWNVTAVTGMYFYVCVCMYVLVIHV